MGFAVGRHRSRLWIRDRYALFRRSPGRDVGRRQSGDSAHGRYRSNKDRRLCPTAGRQLDDDTNESRRDRGSRPRASSVHDPTDGRLSTAKDVRG